MSSWLWQIITFSFEISLSKSQILTAISYTGLPVSRETERTPLSIGMNRELTVKFCNGEHSRWLYLDPDLYLMQDGKS